MSPQQASFDPTQAYQPAPAAAFDPNGSYAPASSSAQPSAMQVLTQPTDKTDNEYLGYKGLAGVVGATVHGLSKVASSTVDAVKGAISATSPIPKTPGETAAAAVLPGVGPALYRMTRGAAQGAVQGPSQIGQAYGAVKDIDASSDPLGTYANIAEDTAAQGAGQAITAMGTEGAMRAPGAMVDALPSTARAGAALQEVKAVAGDVPINTAKPGNTALEIYTQSQRGANLPSSVGKLVRRLAAPDQPPMTYAEAKDFQSNISKLSANEKMALNPNTKRLVGQLNEDLKSSLQDAADTAGKGQQFQKAMQEYHSAMKLRGVSDAVIDATWKAALSGVGLYGAKKIIESAVPGAPGH